MNDKLTLGGHGDGVIRHHEIYHPDFAFVTLNSRTHKPISATRVPKHGGSVEQYIVWNRIKKEARHKVNSTDVLYIRGIRKGYSRQIEAEKPDGRGWKKYARFSVLADEDCNITERKPVTYTHEGHEFKDMLWHGSGDRYISPEETMQRVADGNVGLTTLHPAETAWRYWPDHKHWDAYEAAKNALDRKLSL